MIIALVIWLASLFGGGSLQPFSLPIEQATELVKTNVADADRRAQAMDVLVRMEETEKAWATAREPLDRRLQALIKDRASTSAEFDEVFAETRDQAATIQARLLELRFELKAQLTEAEWKAIFPAPASGRK